MGLMVSMQLVIFALALKKSPGQALVCLLIPFYVYVYARKDAQARPFLWLWYFGIALLVAGVIASS
ncbi:MULTISPECIES: hypothetical protein [unclassified Pseudomonas]|uniref:hypothetical protein n=1 Tax=unclassified Pseudomonas TaxID=196821 RepID=UPI001F230277|nr:MULTISPECIES: hypothetical protein [unclassified Pseudomonas]